MTRVAPLSPRAMAAAGWQRIDARPWRKTSAVYAHTSGWRISHCGHLTANWPFSATDPADPGRCVVTHNGLGFGDLRHAITSIAEVLAGEAIATNGRCRKGVRRIVREGQS